MENNKQFEEWLKDKYHKQGERLVNTCVVNFDKLPFSMQWGVYLKYLWEKHGIEINIQWNNLENRFDATITLFDEDGNKTGYFEYEYETEDLEEVQQNIIKEALEGIIKIVMWGGNLKNNN